MLALNMKDKEKEDYATIISYKIRDGKKIKDAIIFER